MTDRIVTLTRQQDGTYRAERDGKQVTAPVSQRFGVESIDRARAEYEAVEMFSDPEVKRVREPDGTDREDATDRARYDREQAEIYAALVRWKVPAYDRMLTDAGRNPPAELGRKRDYWVAESQRLGRGDGRSHR